MVWIGAFFVRVCGSVGEETDGNFVLEIKLMRKQNLHDAVK
jgi:hypothetical protein